MIDKLPRRARIMAVALIMAPVVILLDIVVAVLRSLDDISGAVRKGW